LEDFIGEVEEIDETAVGTDKEDGATDDGRVRDDDDDDDDGDDDELGLPEFRRTLVLVSTLEDKQQKIVFMLKIVFNVTGPTILGQMML